MGGSLQRRRAGSVPDPFFYRMTKREKSGLAVRDYWNLSHGYHEVAKRTPLIKRAATTLSYLHIATVSLFSTDFVTIA